MRNINVVAIECMRELDIIGIEYGNIIRFDVDTRSKGRWGLCKRVDNGFIISINQTLLFDSTDINGLKNTIIHEILHTCKDCMKHTGNWKVLAEKVNKYYGYGIKRCSSAEEKGAEKSQAPAKYQYVCECCGTTVNRHRASAFTKNPERYKCALCGGKFKRIK